MSESTSVLEQANVQIEEQTTLIHELLTRIKELEEALAALGVLPDGYCWCFNAPHLRNAELPEAEHTGECQAARAVLAGKQQP